ncbi:hypothetical protein IWQ61_000205 [Dispira simplex]|nr:hypothetical protein IWQ61_000205 [Dispira simplex]
MPVDRKSPSRSHHRPQSRSQSPRPRRQTDAKSFRKETRILDDPALGPPMELTENDYYAKNPEFRRWLHRKKHMYFDELSSKENRRYFAKFVKAWNRGELSERYYRGIRSSELTSKVKTRHQWDFTKHVNDQDRERIRDTMEELSFKPTQRTSLEQNISSFAPNHYRQANADPHERTLAHEEAQKRRQSQERHERRKRCERETEILDELAPKETGSLAKEKAWEDQRQERRRQRTEERQHDLQGRLQDHQAKEQETIAKFRQMAQTSRNMGLGMFQPPTDPSFR